MTVRLRSVGRIDQPMRFFGRFTWRDLVRLGAPLGIGALAGGLPGAIVGGALGAGLAIPRPFTKPLDAHAVNAARWKARALSRRIGAEPAAVTDDHLVAPDGRTVGIVKIQPTNLEMRHEDGQLALHRVYQDLLYTIDAPIEVHSRQTPMSMEAYITRMERAAPGDIATDLAEWCRELCDREKATTQHYIVVTADTVDRLDSRCRTVVDALNTIDLGAERVRRGELHHLAGAYTHASIETTRSAYTLPETRVGTHRRMVYIRESPKQLQLGWPVELLRRDGMVDVVQCIHPLNTATAAKKLRRLQEKLDAEIESQLRSGLVGVNELEARLADIEWLLDRLSGSHDEELFRYSAYAVAHGTDADSCDRTFTQLCDELDRMGIRYERPMFRSDRAFYTESPLHGDALGETMLLPGGAVAAGFPFATENRNEGRGIILGVDAYDGRPILTDRWGWDTAGHLLRVGMTGSGKSFATSLEVIRSIVYYDDLQVYIIDPKDDYGPLAALDGTVLTLGDDEFHTDASIAVYQLPERGQRSNVELVIDAVEDVYAATARDESPTLVVIDEAHTLLEEPDGSRVLSRFLREARDTNTAITLVTQTVRELLRSDECEVIVDNTPCVALMYHERRVPPDAVDLFGLSKRETEEILALKTGGTAGYSEAILKISDRVDTKIRIEAADAEYRLIEDGEAQ